MPQGAKIIANNPCYHSDIALTDMISTQMNRSEIKKTLEALAENIASISDERVASVQKTLFNLVEVLVDANAQRDKIIQELKDEINRLKGEQGKPQFDKKKPEKLEPVDSNHSSEDDRNKRKKKKKRKKKIKKTEEIKVDRRVIIEINKDDLPFDAQYKGMEKRILQDLKIITDNVEFSLPVYYSPSLKKTFIATLPEGYVGEFGPGIRALIISLYRDSKMTEPAIARFLKTFGVSIANSTISRMLTEGHDVFHQEKEDIIDAGLQSTTYQHIDDTTSKVAGKSYYTHILCNPYYTAFFTLPGKDRLTLLSMLCREELRFTINKTAYKLMTELGLSERRLKELQSLLPNDVILTRDEIDAVLQTMFPKSHKNGTSRKHILEATAIVYYRGTALAIKQLVADDAPQFNLISEHKSACWVHDGRHYNKLNPIIPAHRVILDAFIKTYWDYYQKLLDYTQTSQPTDAMALNLSLAFAELFSSRTGYDELDARIAKTLAKKESLLLVLLFPFLPLHNNPAELGARVQARIRDINLQTVSINGTKSKDTFATIFETARKLGVNAFHYVYDRVSKQCKMQSLADMIHIQPRNPILNTT